MTFWTVKKHELIASAAILLILAVFSAGIFQIARAEQQGSDNQSDGSEPAPENLALTNSVFVPLLFTDYPWESPFGIESNLPLLDANTMLPRASELQLGWARMGNQISWRELQPNPGDTIQWGQLAAFEDELRGMKAAGIRPVVVIKDHPHWALDPVKARDADGNLTSCGAVDAGYFDEFAAFAGQLVQRYKTDEFNVHDWELGNEPDVDPTMVPQNHQFGCWGDADDPYYGGEHYGRMLKVVAPAIRKADSRAKVWIGGLLLASPSADAINSKSELFTRGILEDAGTESLFGLVQTLGSPEMFFKGILEIGGAPYFDIVPYHWYPSFWDAQFGPLHDYDNDGNSPWDTWGGGTIGKARFLRQVMAEYSVQKPVVLNEAGFACSEKNPDCLPPQPIFYSSQASHLIRFSVRGLSEDVSGLSWYTLNGPGWRFTGLLDGLQQPKDVFNAFQQLSSELRYARYLYQPGYGPFIEAHAFRRGKEQVHILWSKDDQNNQFYVPASKFIRMVTRDGAIIYDQNLPPPVKIGTDYLLDVGFSPVYIVRYP